MVLEMSGRTGGNGIPAVIKRATGVDVEEATIRLALGEAWRPPEAEDGAFSRGAGSLVFGSRSGGTLRKVGSLAQVQQLVPQLVELNFAVPLGNPVRPFEHNGNLIGYAVFDCEPPATYADVAARIAERSRYPGRCERLRDNIQVVQLLGRIICVTICVALRSWRVPSSKATPHAKPNPILVTNNISAISAASLTGIPASVSSAVSVTSRMP